MGGQWGRLTLPLFRGFHQTLHRSHFFRHVTPPIRRPFRKPVVLVSSNEGDVPFDLKHIRVIIYDSTDPFWGPKLLEKVAENILSAIQNPEEAVFKGVMVKP